VLLDGGVVIGDNRPPEDAGTRSARGQ
jgi:hypothetical protein